MNILLCNDDSHRSPLLAFIIEKLKTIGALTIVVPKHEQSWKGKSMMRFENLHQEEIVIGDTPAFTIDGTPADCINIGIHHICKKKPDLVVSGINAGLNVGLGFVFSSGTVGACFEANIAGIPSIALSQMFDSETMNRYTAEYALPESTVGHLEKQTRRLLDKVFGVFLSKPYLLKSCITWNINFPFRVHDDAPLRICSLGKTFYGSCYTRSPDFYSHELRDVYRDESPHCDSAILSAGGISVTPIDITQFGQVGVEIWEEYQRAFEG